MPLRIRDYIAAFPERFPFLDPMTEPWKLTADLSRLIERFATSLDASAFRESAGVLVHHKATIEPGAIIKPPAIISVVVANHLNERPDQKIAVHIGGESIPTGVLKFGALIGDHSRVGANAVLSPGTVLPPHTVVARLGLIDQRGT